MSTFWRGIDRLITLSIVLSALTLLPARHWLIEVNDNLGGYYLFAHLISFVLLFLIHRRRIAQGAGFRIIILLFLIGVYLSAVIPYLRGLPSREGRTIREVTVGYSNIYGGNEEASRLFDFFKKDALPDILVILELSPATKLALDLESKYPNSREIVRSDNFGIGVYSKFPFVGEIKEEFGEGLPPAIVTQFELSPGVIFDFAAIHAVPPLGGGVLYRNKLLLRRIVTPLRHFDNVIVVGDLNATPYSEVYEKFYDAGRLRDAAWGYGLSRTWNAKNPFINLIIDHVFYKGRVRVKDFRVGPDIGSDHYPILTSFEVTDR